MRLKKSLGQHLLTDGRALARIVKAAGVLPGDACLEIGPGTGNLTRRLLDAGASVTAVELDDAFAAALQEFAADLPGGHLRVIHADVLEADFTAIISGMLPAPGATGQGGVKVVANLPYNIGTAIILKLLETAEAGNIESMTLLVQKEVADRIAAAPGDSARGSLSVYCQSRAECRPGFSVPPKAFRPPPAVTSRVITLKPRKNDEISAVERPFFDVLTYAGFEHPRKTCYNSLRMSIAKGAGKCLAAPVSASAFGSPDGFLDKLFDYAETDKNIRAHQIDESTWVKMAQFAAKSLRDIERLELQ